MRKFPVPLALMAAALACSPLALATTSPPPSSGSDAANGPWHGMHHAWQGMRHGRHGMGMLRKLGLTDAQRSSIDQLRKQVFRNSRTEMQAMREKRMAFANATPGSAQYRAAADELARAESRAAQARVLRRADLRAKIYEVLTPAQRTQLATIRALREARMQQWRESHAPPSAPAPSSATQS